MNAAILQSSAGPFNHQLTTKISYENYTPIADLLEDFRLKGKGGENASSKKEIKFVESKGLVFVKNGVSPFSTMQQAPS